MAIKRTCIGAHLLVSVEVLANYKNDPDRIRRAAIKVKKEIDRHCDSHTGVEINLEWDEVCSHCGYAWGESADSKHNGGCCDADLVIFRNEGGDSSK